MRDIVEKGAAWFTSYGRRERKGLRSFSVSGRVRKPGVVLAPAGVTVRELIEEYCGGMTEGHEFKAYLPGGASGGILPASMADLPLDFGTLEKYGCFVGSHAVVILSDKDDMKAVALNLMRFFEDESCGQCTPCRVGTEKAVKLMATGPWDQALLTELSDAMRDASICGLGQAAPNPLLSVLKYFPEELSKPLGTGDVMSSANGHNSSGTPGAGAPMGYGHDDKGAAIGAAKNDGRVHVTHRNEGSDDRTVAFTLDGVEVTCAHGRDDLAGGEAPGHRHPASVLFAQAGLPPRRQLPCLHGRGRRRARAGRELHPHADAGDEGEDPDRSCQDGAQDGGGTSAHRSTAQGRRARSGVAILADGGPAECRRRAGSPAGRSRFPIAATPQWRSISTPASSAISASVPAAKCRSTT